jgi:hypothetical protein
MRKQEGKKFMAEEERKGEMDRGKEMKDAG